MAGSSLLPLEGKCTVVIGGTSGLGHSAVKAFIAAGSKVVAVGLPHDDAGSEGLTREFGPSAQVVWADATLPGTAPSAIEQCLSSFGGFDALYHVAGGSGRRWGDGPLHDITDQGWSKTLELNLSSV
ncbi:MAG TPA: SDR family oxidoreductase, partial [Verrucomicrobiae bacterium]|nr:SDR family oxidoreductase [Verrucomicrobiae bacterium]